MNQYYLKFAKMFVALHFLVISNSNAADQSDIPLSPVVSGNWVLQGKEFNAWAEKILHDNYGKNVTPYKVRMKPIAFYSTNNKDVELMEVTPVGRSGAYYFIVLNGSDTRVILLDGESKPIHKLNQLLEISIDTPEKAVSYLKFFCSAITSEEGIFLVIDPNASEVSSSFLRSINAKPIQVKQESSGDWNITASQVYANTLFDVDFIVHRNGGVEMRNDTPKQKLPLQFKVKIEDGRRIYKESENQNNSNYAENRAVDQKNNGKNIASNESQIVRLKNGKTITYRDLWELGAVKSIPVLMNAIEEDKNNYISWYSNKYAELEDTVSTRQSEYDSLIATKTAKERELSNTKSNLVEVNSSYKQLQSELGQVKAENMGVLEKLNGAKEEDRQITDKIKWMKEENEKLNQRLFVIHEKILDTADDERKFDEAKINMLLSSDKATATQKCRARKILEGEFNAKNSCL